MSKRLLPFVPRQLVVEQVKGCADRVIIVCRGRFAVARCPSCRRKSTRTHSHYQRRISDIP